MDASRDVPTRESRPTRSPSDEKWSFQQLLHLGELHLCAESYGEALGTFFTARDQLGGGQEPDPRGVIVSLRIADCQILRGGIDEATTAIEEAERFAGPDIDDLARAHIAGRRGMLLAMSGDYPEAIRVCRSSIRSLHDAREDDDVTFQGRVYLALGHSFHRLGQLDEAGSAFEKALGLFQSVGDRRGASQAYNHLGLNRKRMFRLREAISLLHRALEISDEVGAYDRKAATRLNLGIIHTRLGEWDRARSQLLRATQIARELDNPGRLSKTLLASGNLHLRCREYSKAEAYYREAGSIARERGYGREAILAEEFQAELLTATGNPKRAIAILERALGKAEALAPGGDLSAEVLRRLADARFASGEIELAQEVAQRAVRVSEAIGDVTEQALAQRIVGLCSVLSGRVEDGYAQLQVAIKGLQKAEAVFEEAQTHLAIAATLLSVTPDDAERDEIATHLSAARSRFDTLEIPGYIAEVLLEATRNDIRLGRLDQAERLLRSAGAYVEASSENSLLENQMRLKAKLDRRHQSTLESSDAVSASRELHRLFRDGVDLDAAMGELLSLALRRTSSDRAILAKGPDQSSLKILAAKGVNGTRADELMAAIEDVVRSSMEDGLPTVRTAGELGTRGPLREVAGVVVAPLCLPSDIWGVLYLDRSRKHIVGPYRQADLKLTALLAEVAAISVLAFERKQVMRERDEMLRGLDGGRFTRPIVTNSAEMHSILQVVQKVADSPASVLLEGETGTGKGLIARAIHESGRRRDRSFVQVNCAALPESLLESELFGHVTGAFTGAVKTKRGLFEEAEGGTIFLDEVDKTSRTVQAKLLHVLDHREIRPVGANRWKRVDARIISATNRDLNDVMRSGEFLDDLYYRLNDIAIRVPPLRERREDISLLAQHFASNFAREMGCEHVEVSTELQNVLEAHAWPGNVRELEKVIRRLVVMADDVERLGVEHLPRDVAGEPGEEGSGGDSLKDAVRSVERQLIARTLRACGGNKSEVSRRLKVSYPTLLSKIKAFGLEGQ